MSSRYVHYDRLDFGVFQVLQEGQLLLQVVHSDDPGDYSRSVFVIKVTEPCSRKSARLKGTIERILEKIPGHVAFLGDEVIVLSNEAHEYTLPYPKELWYVFFSQADADNAMRAWWKSQDNLGASHTVFIVKTNGEFVLVQVDDEHEEFEHKLLDAYWEHYFGANYVKVKNLTTYHKLRAKLFKLYRNRFR